MGLGLSDGTSVGSLLGDSEGTSDHAGKTDVTDGQMDSRRKEGSAGTVRL